MTLGTSSIEQIVKEAVARVFHKEVTEISRDTRFIEDLFAKSIKIVELTATLEYRLNIDIPRAQARQTRNVGQTIDLIESLLNK